MERFTNKNSAGRNELVLRKNSKIPWAVGGIDNKYIEGDAIDRFAAYEDTGLTPEQVVEIDRLYREKCEELARLEGFALVSENDRLRRRNAALEIQVKKLEAELKAKEII